MHHQCPAHDSFFNLRHTDFICDSEHPSPTVWNYHPSLTKDQQPLVK
jgi:hypothetical protein